MLAAIRRGPLALPTREEMVEYLMPAWAKDSGALIADVRRGQGPRRRVENVRESRRRCVLHDCLVAIFREAIRVRAAAVPPMIDRHQHVAGVLADEGGDDHLVRDAMGWPDDVRRAP